MAEENKYKEIESKWMEFWESHPELFHATDDSSKPKKYVLVEFPYPSGSGLHVGHAFSFTGGDVYARFKRMQGYNVLFPMGWDAFGLPTENYAIKTKRKPQDVTKENTDKFRSQMKHLAFSFDWAREVNTTDPNYYKWTQWIFIQLFKKGLAYKQEMPINWCPSCKIGLANEEVVNGKCERCGAEVERRTISQWVVKITEYADKLIEGLEKTNFIEKVKMQQINWIGKSEGARVKFRVSDSTAILQSSRPSGVSPSDDSGLKIGSSSDLSELEVFTTRPDTLYGVTFAVISPEHEFINKISDIRSQISDEDRKKIIEYVKQAKKKSDLERAELQKEKTGVYTGINLINPVNGKEVPLYVADYVLMGYGTGVVMGVPAHDERDFDFAKKYNLDVVPVIGGASYDSPVHDYEKSAMSDVGSGVMINSGEITGLAVKDAIKKMNSWLEEKGIGKKENMYHLRDWIFSRQHYWGEPIPMIFCKSCAENQKLETGNEKLEEFAKVKKINIDVLRNNPGWYPEEESQLPIVLPEVDAYEPTDTGESPLANISDWVDTVCPICGGKARRETDTMPNWAGSDWYFMRYTDPVNDTVLASYEQLKKWMPVDVYIGGDEHNTLHLLYSRFIYKFLYDLGVVPEEYPEPYYKRLSHGVILGPDNQRMSKSRGNVIVPEMVSDKYGVDVVRSYLMFMGPFDATMAWNENTLMGVKRFLDKFEKFIANQLSSSSVSQINKKTESIVHKTIRGVTDDIENYRYNTAIAKMMECLNELTASKENIGVQNIKRLIKLVAPFAPYLSEELWSRVKAEEDELSVHISAWPVAEEKYLIEETINIPVAINGKVREQLIVESQKVESQKEIIEQAKALPKILEWLTGKEVVKEIYIPGKMVNLVVK